uniref:DDE Tnp4 domain-containing protein n=1 Tax=Sparus aurata TaxID=8175 RepID=A0A671VQE7_SPAAU
MPGRTCCVFGCFNNSAKIQAWNKTACEIHKPLLHIDCPCLRPYGLHQFPGRAEDQDVRQKVLFKVLSCSHLFKKYLQSMHRSLCIYLHHHSSVCGIPFPDGQPTRENPYPVLFMGYDCHVSRSLGQPYYYVDVGNLENMPLQTHDVGIQWPDHMDHNYSFSCGNKPMKDCGTQTDPTPSVSAQNLNNKDFIFFTGLCADSFWQLLQVVLTFCSQTLNTKLAVHEQFLLVLMRLRLGLLFTDLGRRFGVSRTTASEIFTFWRPILARFMREKVIVWLPRDTLNRIRPKTFHKNYPKATCIIDCTEVVVQRPKNVRKRSQTYSIYKHHNTYKLLYCIASNGYVMFVSKVFGGRASDNFITKNSDRRFTIKDILPPGVSLALPAFTRGRKELSEHEVTSTRRLANVRIHIERAIRRLKGFKILSNVISGRLQSVDEIVTICAGLCNLQPQLIRNSTE